MDSCDHVCCSLTHRIFGACHCRQLRFFSDGELIGPGPVGNDLSPCEAVPILSHLCYHLVVCLGIEKPCGRAGKKRNSTHNCQHTPCVYKNHITKRFQKLLVVLLTLQLIFSTESHDGEKGEVRKEFEVSSEVKRGVA